MKRILILTALLLGTTRVFAPIFQNAYTTTNTAAVDAHVIAIAGGSGSGITNNQAGVVLGSSLTVTGATSSATLNLGAPSGGSSIIQQAPSGLSLHSSVGNQSILINASGLTANGFNGDGGGLNDVNANMATNVVGSINITNATFYSDSTHFAWFYNAALTSSNTADGTDYQLSHKYLNISTSNLVNQLQVMMDGSNALFSIIDLGVGTNGLTITPTNFNFGGRPILGYGASLTNPAAMSANTNGLASLTQAAQIAAAVAGAIVGNGANALSLSLTGAAAAGQSNVWVSLGTVTNNYQANFMAQAFTNLYFSGCSNMTPGFNFTMWITQGSTTSTNLVTFNTNYWQPQIFGQILALPVNAVGSGELISCFATGTNTLKFTQTLFP